MKAADGPLIQVGQACSGAAGEELFSAAEVNVARQKTARSLTKAGGVHMCLDNRASTAYITRPVPG